jgi:hypothetical protein
MPYSWKLSTPLSNFEAGNNYKDVQDPTVTCRVRATSVKSEELRVKSEGSVLYFLIWTTTPWTLPSNLAICAGASLDYVAVRDMTDEARPVYVMAKARLPFIFKNEEMYEIVWEGKGEELKDSEYEPIFPYFADKKAEGAFRVTNDDYVTTDDGVGLVHIDSRCDMHEAYQGFDFSHASTMYNILRDVPQVKKFVSVGVQEFSPIEWERATSDSRVKMFTAQDMWREQFEGTTWAKIVSDIINELPENVYLALDIDGLTGECSPNKSRIMTGGMSFHQVVYLMDRIIASGRRIVGFDITEVSPNMDNKADMRLVARLLFKMCSIALKSVDNNNE